LSEWFANAGDVDIFASYSRFVWTLILGSIIVWTAWVDLRTLRIPALASPLLLVFGLGRLWVASVTLETLLWPCVGAILTGGLFWLVGVVFKHYQGNAGLGSGDPLYAASLALWIDPLNIPWAVMMACCVTLLVGAVTKRFGLGQLGYMVKIPFAPGLGIGFGVVCVVGG
jgi:prepilin signal peptidase PulO-like enzyme (type II secretory pathway)